MWYDPKKIKYPRNRETGNPSQEDLLKIMDEVPEYTYIAICDYLKEAIRRDEVVDIEELERKYYMHPVESAWQTHYLTSFYFLAYYHYRHNLYPLKAMDYLHMALQERASYDSSCALLIRFYIEGFGVKPNLEKAKEIWKKAKEEINTWPYKFEIHDYSVFNMEL